MNALRSNVSKMAGQYMKAVRVYQFGEPEVLKLKSDIPIPEIGDNDVLVRMKAAGINPVDTYIRTGTYAARIPDLPYTPGMDGAGIVESVGAGVESVKAGDRVFCTRSISSGTYAQFCAIPQEGVFPLPDSVSFSQGAAIGVPYFTAYRALFQKCHAKSAETVLIHGASGAVGLAAVQIARSSGLQVFGTAGSDEGLAVVTQNGAHAVFNHRTPGYMDEIIKHNEEQGVDVILEMLSNVNLGDDLKILNRGGRVAVIGCRGPVEINPRLMMGKESSIIGVALMTSSDEDWREMSAAVEAGLEQGWCNPVVHKEYYMDKVESAHIQVVNNAFGTRGKLVLQID